MDPYIVIEINGKKHRTITKRSGGRFPNWKYDEQKFELELRTPFDSVKISAYDEDLIFDDFLGSTTVKASELADLRPNSDWIDLFVDKQKQGSVQLISKLVLQLGNSCDTEATRRKSILK